jgi:AbrB family looped-hinge helix DNA binding protein
MEEVLVTRKGQITIPIALRRKYGIKQGMKMMVQDSGEGIILKVVPRFEDLIGIDAGKKDPKKAIEMLDKMRSEDRY